jgi:hypothetical protein
MAGNTFPAMKDAFSGTTTDDNDVLLKTAASIHSNLDSASNEIDDSELQDENHSEQRI